MSMTGKVALITDASTQAAEAVAKRLEQDGMTVLRNYPDGLPESARDNPRCCSHSTVSLQAVQDMSRWVKDTTKGLDCFVHTDNVIYRAKVEDISENDFRNCVDRNAKSAFLTTKVLADDIAKNGGGSVVYLSSLHDEKPTGSSVAYSAGRGAVKMLCREMALFFGRRQVRCNLVEMDTTAETAEMLDSVLIPFNYDLESRISLRRMTKPDDFAGTVSYLLSEDAFQVNGAEIRVDGGHLFHYFDR
jgi:glucose 1-dehydrogenase